MEHSNRGWWFDRPENTSMKGCGPNVRRMDRLMTAGKLFDVVQPLAVLLKFITRLPKGFYEIGISVR